MITTEREKPRSGFYFTDGDTEIVKRLIEYRFLQPQDFRKLTGRNIVSLRRRLRELLALRQAFTCRTRTIPIGRSLQYVLKEYDHSIVRTRHGCRNFFVNEDGRAVRPQALARNFRRCCFDAKIFEQGGVGSRPCLRDLRRTFAVHCLEAWLRGGRDLRSMLPLLAAYMGLAKLTSTEAYLSMTPERFRGSLLRLKGFRAP